MAFSKVTLNNDTLMDVTQDTVASSNLLSGETATGANGETVEGAIEIKQTGPTVVPTFNTSTGNIHIEATTESGYYDSNKTTTGNYTPAAIGIPTQGSKTVTPSESAQSAVTAGKYTTGEVTVGAISSTYVGSGITQRNADDMTASGASVTAPAGYYAEASSKAIATATQATPSVEINSSTGLVTATSAQAAGYVSGGTKTGTLQLSVQGAKTVTPSESSQTAVAAGKYTTGAVTVGAVSSTYVGSGIAKRSASDITASGAVVSVPAGYYASNGSKSVASGTEGTPTATKGTVTDHSISVTPSVTNSAGYISGGTHSGTAVTVNVSELESGTKTITENGTGISVSGYSNVDVDVSANPEIRSLTVTPSLEQQVFNGIGYDIEQTLENGTYTNSLQYGSTETGGSLSYLGAQGSLVEGETYSVSGEIYVNTVSVTLSGEFEYSFKYTNNAYNYTYTETIPFTPKTSENSKAPSWIGFQKSLSGVIVFAIYGAGAGEFKFTTDIVISKDIDGYLPVTVNAIPSEYIIPTGTKMITENGTNIDVAQYESVDVNVSGGGGTIPASPKDVNFIDYDGTILYSYTKAEFAQLDALPANPDHGGDDIPLTSQGWNWTLAQINAQLTAQPNDPVTVGQMYVTTDGKTYIEIELHEGRLSPYLGIAVNGTVVVDWGDNSATSMVTGTSLTTQIMTLHEYAAAGRYTVSISVSSGSFAFYGTSSYTLLNKNSSTANQNRVYSNAVQSVRIGNNASIGNHAFDYCYSLASITIPSGVTSIGSYAFGYCFLASITIPSGVTSISSYTFAYCYSLASITIPSGVTSISSGYAFYNCYSLASITIPSGVTSIGVGSFYNCYSLASITIPSGVTSISNNAFYYCYGLAELRFLSTTPPTVANSNAFSNIPTDCVISVPTGSLSAYTSATNYPSSSTYTYIEE